MGVDELAVDESEVDAALDVLLSEAVVFSAPPDDSADFAGPLELPFPA